MLATALRAFALTLLYGLPMASAVLELVQR